MRKRENGNVKYMQNRLTNSQRYLVEVGLVGLGLPLTVTLGLVGLVLWLVPGLAFTKYHCEFVNLFCIYASKTVSRHFGPRTLRTQDISALVRHFGTSANCPDI